MSWPIILLIALSCLLGAGWALHTSWLHGQLDSARTCPITELVTRRPFMREAKRILRRKNPLVVFIDLDSFKEINDRNSHETGDWVLRAVATRLRAHFGPQAVVGRLYGDEFGVVAQSDPGNMPELLTALLVRIEQPIELPADNGSEPETLRVTVSVGAVHAGAVRRPDLSAVLHRADLLMFEAKRAGRACVRMHVAEAGEASLARAPRRPERRTSRSGSRVSWRRDRNATNTTEEKGSK
jgi:diguanylate cyclase (GGDEF)-like protein